LYHNGHPFSTKDRDNDGSNGFSCSIQDHGAWWYVECHHSNLNGQYRTVGPGDATGLSWWYWKNTYYSMKHASMKIRPISYN